MVADHFMTDQLAILRQFLIDHAHRLRYWEGGADPPEVPEFDLFPRDYLAAAERDFVLFADPAARDPRLHRNDCVQHLKQAIDCAADVFLSVFGLYDYFSAKNLKLPAKLAFLDAAGVTNKRSLVRLNTIRNRIEHDYAAPELPELEVYLDLAGTFVSTLEYSSHLARHLDGTFLVFDDDGHETYAGVYLGYDFDVPELTLAWDEDGWPSTSLQRIVVAADQFEEFAAAFRVMMLLLQSDHFMSAGYVRHVLGEAG